MSNHMHLVLQFDPACVEAWSDQEVAERWNRLFPQAKMNEAQQAARINAWLARDGKIANMRERLASVSESLVGRSTRSARCKYKRRRATSDRVQRRSSSGMNEAAVCSR